MLYFWMYELAATKPEASHMKKKKLNKRRTCLSCILRNDHQQHFRNIKSLTTSRSSTLCRGLTGASWAARRNVRKRSIIASLSDSVGATQQVQIVESSREQTALLHLLTEEWERLKYERDPAEVDLSSGSSSGCSWSRFNPRRAGGDAAQRLCGAGTLSHHASLDASLRASSKDASLHAWCGWLTQADLW